MLIDIVPVSGSGRFPATGAEFTAIDFETTGLQPGRIIEVAAVRFRADGTVLGEFSTLVDPGPGVDPGPARVHGITRAQLDSAPPLGQVVGQLLDLCRGSVLVGHNLAFEQGFLAAELERIGLRLPTLPGVCTLAAARAALRLPNYRLTTVAEALGLGGFPAHMAAPDARACAQVLAALVTTHGLAFERRFDLPRLPRLAVTGRAVSRPEPARAAAGTWISGLVDRIEAAGTPYADLLADALADHHLSDAEAADLAALAAASGMSPSDVRGAHLDFVAAMRAVAESDGIVTDEEERELRHVAQALGVPEALRDLRRATAADRTRVLVLGRSAAADALRAAVLAARIPLAKNLTATVTHLAVADDVPATEPRLTRARELGAAVLDVPTAWQTLGLVPPQQRVAPPPRPTAVLPPVPVPTPAAALPPVPRDRRWIAWIMMGTGLVLMFLTVIALFGGAGLGAGIPLGAIGVGLLLGGWTVGDPQSRYSQSRYPAISSRNA
ncbi:DNA polymerase III subunit epsilon [Amycolatopsis deserti]|uniref:DNA polymerase III subunit epsilon n=1 Tax=Amycolatopsis deserti TaxID=185696 RepID=A0ABQ3JBC7_9PSEU|nr:3'-5' exonuclease [Amycolatopsis deserti]GHF09225.1 DNA polymerase III subunit epsilon [Amycolatopsis deserti]